MKVRIFDNAKLDLVEGYRFYEDQASGIGQYFLDSIYAPFTLGEPPLLSRRSPLTGAC
jgi:hypothetical protein